MALLDFDIGNTARHLGYDIIGLWQNAPGGASMAYGGAGYRYFDDYGSLLYRLNQMRPEEECRLTGRAYGAVAFTGLNPQPGDTVTVTLTGGGLLAPCVAVVTVPTPTNGRAPWSLLNVAGALTQAFMIQGTFQAAGFFSAADYGSGPYSQQSVGVPISSFIAAPNQQFSLTATFNGTTVPQIIASGKLLPPFLSFRQVGNVNVVWGYLPIMDYLEGAYGGSSANMAISRAEEVVFRTTEAEDRMDQYNVYQQKLSDFLGIAINPKKRRSGGGGFVTC